MSNIMVNVNRLRGKIAENDVSLNDLASELNMSYDTLNRRMKNGDKFTIKEVNCIVKYLHLTAEDAIAIFFCRLCRINAIKRNQKHYKKSSFERG